MGTAVNEVLRQQPMKDLKFDSYEAGLEALRKTSPEEPVKVSVDGGPEEVSNPDAPDSTEPPPQDAPKPDEPVKLEV